MLRNSWGSWWGDGGFAKVSAEPGYDLALTSLCSFAVPSGWKPATAYGLTGEGPLPDMMNVVKKSTPRPT